ncbi:MAG: nucleotidyltransferase domain-containing protein [Candidatus Odinarchaeota archaeon]|nr:nucleotidyltransferase domain-containing protein [Candidatus Odinarchaeota archaeon]
MDKRKLSKIKKDLAFLEDFPEIHSVLLFGSYVSGEATQRSDIDVCIVIPYEKDEKIVNRIYGIVVSKLSNKPEYDISIFEQLPLYIKAEVIENHIIIFSRDELELYEYFYFYRKLWNDQKHRQQVTKEELMRILQKKHT